ncbi:MAG: YciI family protein [Thermomicrobiaceae bacterium]
MKFATVFRYENKERIQDVRPDHREYLAKLHAEGKLHTAGPFTDDSGSLIVYEVETEQEAKELIENDPFHEAGIFASYAIKPWKQTF